MDINQAFPSKYLKASDLEGQRATVTISSATQEELGGDLKVILYFQGKEKGMVLNKTNAYTISAMYGPITENWIGRQIEIFATMVTFQGQPVPALRVAPPMQQQTPQQPVQQPQPNAYQQAQQGPVTPQPAQGQQFDERNPPPVEGNPIDLDDEVPFAPEWRG